MTQEERLQEKERQLEDLKERNRKAEEVLRIRNRRLRNAVDAKKKKMDTRRKILTGAAVMEAAKTSPEFSRLIRHARQRHLTRKSDRAVFGLPPLDNLGEPSTPPDAPSAPSGSRDDPIPGWKPKHHEDTWAAIYEGDTSKLPDEDELVGCRIVVKPRNSTPWTATVTKVLEYDNRCVIVRTSARPDQA